MVAVTQDWPNTHRKTQPDTHRQHTQAHARTHKHKLTPCRVENIKIEGAKNARRVCGVHARRDGTELRMRGKRELEEKRALESKEREGERVAES